MIFLSPWAFSLLLPWGAAVYWSFRGFSAPAAVPFLLLWEHKNTESVRHRSIKLPPVWIVLLLMAMLLCIVAAAGLAFRSRHAALTLIIDHRLALSPPTRVSSALAPLHLSSSDDVREFLIPGPSEPIAADGPIADASVSFTADPDDRPLLRAIRDRLNESDAPVYVVTDAAIPIDDPRVVRLAPSRRLNNAGIDRFAVTDGPHPQAMVRAFNGTGQHTATLIIDQTRTPIDLPARGLTQDYFIPLPALKDRAQVRLEIVDDIAADNTAYLVRGQAWPSITIKTPVSEALRRMIDVYAKHRAATIDSPRIAIVSTSRSADGPTVILPAGPIESLAADAPLSVDPDAPITHDVDWPAAAVTVHRAGPPDGWRPVVRRGGVPLVAVRESPRGVWVAIEDADWSKRADYVVFWTNVFDWIGQGNATFSSLPVPAVMNQPVAIARPVAQSVVQSVAQSDAKIIESPGLYRDADGRLLATSIRAVRPSGGVTTPTLKIHRENIDTPIELARYTLLAALVLCAAALALRGT